MNLHPRPCPACGEPDAAPFLTTGFTSSSGEVYRVLTCSRCGLLFTLPVPPAEELSDLYPDHYYSRSGHGRSPAEWVRSKLQKAVLAYRTAPLREMPEGRILDVGCGDGHFLASLIEKGWEAHGCDASEAAVRLAESRGVRARRGSLPDLRYPSRHFDVVTLWHVLEHLPEPAEVLGEIRRILKPRGLLVVEVPDSASWTLRLCGPDWYGLDVPRHLQHFSPPTLENLLRETDFLPVLRTSFHPFDFLLAATSFMYRLRVLGRRRSSPHFVEHFRTASLVRRMAFLFLGAPVLAGSLVYSFLATWLGGSGETLRLVAQRNPD